MRIRQTKTILTRAQLVKGRAFKTPKFKFNLKTPILIQLVVT